MVLVNWLEDLDRIWDLRQRLVRWHLELLPEAVKLFILDHTSLADRVDHDLVNSELVAKDVDKLLNSQIRITNIIKKFFNMVWIVEHDLVN